MTHDEKIATGLMIAFGVCILVGTTCFIIAMYYAKYGDMGK